MWAGIRISGQCSGISSLAKLFFCLHTSWCSLGLAKCPLSGLREPPSTLAWVALIFSLIAVLH
jgi:hypothetical protein